VKTEILLSTASQIRPSMWYCTAQRDTGMLQ